MPSPAEYQLQYFRVRNALLGRHFAINRHGRVNVASLTTFLAATPSTPDDMTARWNVQEHQWENPLLWSGRLLPALAVEHELGNPGAKAILGLALESLASLYKFDNATG